MVFVKEFQRLIARMEQPLFDLLTGYARTKAGFVSSNIPIDICKLCGKYVDIDIITTTNDHPKCDYKIPFVFKARQNNATTLYFGCESYKIFEDEGTNKIRFNLPYCYINQTKEWYRIQGGGGMMSTNAEMAARHLSYIMKLKYDKNEVDFDRWSVYAQTDYNMEAIRTMRQMFYEGWHKTAEDPGLGLEYCGRGHSYCSLGYFSAPSHCDMIIVHESE